MVTVVYGDDWIGLYLESSLVLEGHSLQIADVVELLIGEPPDRVRVDADWMRDVGRLPGSLSEVIISS